MNKIIKDACILFVITLVAGVLLGGVYDITKAPIANQSEKAKQEAYRTVMVDADAFEELEGVNLSDGATAFFTSSSGEDFSSDEITEVVAGVKNNKIVGFVITVVAGDGYAGDIKFSVGITADGEYKGTSILSISETAGLGMRVKTSPDFLSQFENKTVEQFSLVKDGTGSSADDKIDAISGSTVTSKAVTKGINAALTAYKAVSANAKTVGGATIE